MVGSPDRRKAENQFFTEGNEGNKERQSSDFLTFVTFVAFCKKYFLGCCHLTAERHPTRNRTPPLDCLRP
jgi:hypothetical protein